MGIKNRQKQQMKQQLMMQAEASVMDSSVHQSV